MRWMDDFWKSLLTPFEDRTILEWADGNLKLPQSVRYPVFLAEEAAWLSEPLRAISDPNVKRVDIRGPAGSAKSLIGEIHIAYVIENDPGFYYYVWQTDDDAKDAMEDRVVPMLEGNETLFKLLPTDRAKKRIQKIAFFNMPLYAVGANESAAQSKRVKYLTMEEPHMYKPGMMRAFEKRIEGVKNPKIITLSTGSVIGDESDEAFNSGSCEEWEVPCPFCNQFQRMTDQRDRLKSDRDENTIDKDGHFIWHKLLETVRYNCEHCGMDWPKDQAFRRKQSLMGRYTATNTNSKVDHRSFHIEASAIYWVSLESILEEKLKASYAAKRGALEPLKDYMQKRRALAWDESPADNDGADVERMTGQYLKLQETGVPGKKIGEFDGEIGRFLTIDNQAGRASRGEGAHRWYVCRAWSGTESRIIDEGRIVTWEELEELRIKLGVEPDRTLVDCAFDTQAVQSVCLRYGWLGLWGDTTNKDSYPHHEQVITQNGPQRVTRKLPYSPVNFGHVGLGLNRRQGSARYFFWCNQPIATLYHRIRSGMTTYRMTIAQDTSEAYKKQTAVEYKRQMIDSKGGKYWAWFRPPSKDDHLLDADQMNLVAAMMDSRIRPFLYTFTDEVGQVKADSN
jgi:hypothetical protein